MHDPNNGLLRAVYLSNPIWHALFFGVGLIILLVIGLSATLILGVSSADDRVFSVEALVAGVGADRFLRIKYGLKLMIFPQLPISLIMLWPFLCGYVFLVRPFE